MAIYRHSYVWRLASDPVCYLWTGLAPLVTPADDVDASGATWRGAGALLSIPAIKALINGRADRIDWTVSGVDAETSRLALDDRDTVQGAELRLGRVEFDADWQLVGSIHWQWIGTADVLIVESSPAPNGRTRTIGISAASSDTTRSNPNFAFWTDTDQRKRSANDRFCDRVANITQGSTRRFGPR